MLKKIFMKTLVQMFYLRQKISSIPLLLITQQLFGNLRIVALKIIILAMVGLTPQARSWATFWQTSQHQVFHLWLLKIMIGRPKVFTENLISMTLSKLDGSKDMVSKDTDIFSIQTNALRKVATSISTCTAVEQWESTLAFTCSLANMLWVMILS